ncbi:MAG: carbon storage regulator CsrA [Chloroflexota bacterium]|jgi:carbon storage regulator|nr:carbon storage regulator CsrA [Chloroflexota bacterium]
MLILTRKIDESIVIADDIIVTVLEISGERVKIGIDAPRSVTILRHELQEQVRQESIEAAAAAADLEGITRQLEEISDQD